MPNPRKGESLEEFAKRCVPEVMKDGVTQRDGKHRSVTDNKEAFAICSSMHREHHSKRHISETYMDGMPGETNEDDLDLVKEEEIIKEEKIISPTYQWLNKVLNN